MRRPQPRNLVRQGFMIGLPIRFDALRDFVSVRLLTSLINRLATELQYRAKTGRVLSGIQRRIVRWAIEVDHITRIQRHDHRRAQFARKRIQARDMPVGVGHAPRSGHHARGKFVRKHAAIVRQTDQQRRTAAVQGEGLHRAIIAKTQPVCRRSLRTGYLRDTNGCSKSRHILLQLPFFRARNQA